MNKGIEYGSYRKIMNNGNNTTQYYMQASYGYYPEFPITSSYESFVPLIPQQIANVYIFNSFKNDVLTIFNHL